MTDFDAIVIGAGHNGLTAAALLQQAGLRTLCLDSKLYAGGMASTVELFDGFKFEIAGSVQIPTSATVSRELGLDDLPTVDLDVMSVSLRGVGDDPLVYYTDPMKLMTHINEVHGAEAVNGMAGLMAWCQAPTRALGRFDAGQPPKTLDEMYACATNEFERSTITDLLFGSVTDVLDRYLPDKEKHGALRGMLSLLAVNTTYRGPATPGTAAALAYGFAVPDENALLVKKLRGGIGALTSHLCDVFTSNGGELRLRSKVDEILVADERVAGVRLEDGTTLDGAGRDLGRRTGPHDHPAGRRGTRCRLTSGSGSPASTTAAAICRCTSPLMAYRNSRRRTNCSTIPPCSRTSAFSARRRSSSSSGRIAGAALCPPTPPSRCRSRPSTIPASRRPASMPRRPFRCGSRFEEGGESTTATAK